MGRYLLKFSKEDNLKYISHLDLLRVFQRTFKRAGVNLRYSQGFNPHAKIGFAAPLPLGFESEAEYMEFETTDNAECDEHMKALAEALPRGIRVFSCTRLVETSKTSAAAAVRYASYIIKTDVTQAEKLITDKNIRAYVLQESIICEKINKKKKRVETDIRPLILSFSEAARRGGEITLSATLATGSSGNLNPLTLIESFCGFCGAAYERSDWRCRRTEIYMQDEERKGLRPMSEFGG